MHSNEDNRDLNILEEMGYEPTDVEPNAIPKVTFDFFTAMTVMFVIAWAVMSVIDRTSTLPSAKETFTRRRTPEGDAPLVQGNVTAKQDMINLRREEIQKTEVFAWVDEGKGIARVPISVGMEMLLERGVPTRPNARIPEGYKK